jgi:formate dehydrogenase
LPSPRARTVYTQCRICLQTCGLEVQVDEGANRVLSIEPDRQNPYTWSDFCRKGKTANEVVEHPRRITAPMRRVGDRYVRASYDDAIGDISERMNAIIDRHGPDAIGSYTGNPLGFEFGTTAFLNGFLDAIGTGNRFWVGSVDTNNVHYVCEELYGTGLISLPLDIDDCDCFLLVGMDPAVSKFNWTYNAPNGWNRVLARQRAGADLIVVDPRRSVSASRADTHLAILPGQDWALLLGIVKVILEEGLERLSRTVPLDGGVAEVRRLAAEADLDDLARRCGVDAGAIRDVARRFARARTALCVTHTGVAHNEYGTVGEWLGHVLNIITNRLDAAGGRRFERGLVDIGLILKAYAPPGDHRTRLRNLPPVFGFHSLAELADEVITPGPGQIRGVLVAFGNPVVSGPNGRKLDDALSQLELLVSVDLVQRESHRHAHWLIPGTHWLERSDLHVILPNLQERPYVNYGRRAVDPPPGVMPEWEFFTELALAMDRNLFGKPGVNRIIRASRRLAKATRRPGLAMNPEWIQRLLVAAGRRVRFREILDHEHGWIYGEPRYGDLAGALQTPDKKVHVAPAPLLEAARSALASPPVVSEELPLLLVNKRTREAMNSWLNESPGVHRPARENVAEIHPDDARAAGVADGDVVRIRSSVGEIELRAKVSDAMRPGVVCVPHGWGSRIFDPAGGSTPEVHGVNRNVLVDDQRIDPLSQTPALNSTAVRVDPVGAP